MKPYILSIVVIIVCVLIIYNIDKLREASPENYNLWISCGSTPPQIDELEGAVLGIAGIFQKISSGFGFGAVTNVVIGNAVEGATANVPCVAQERTNYIDKRTSFDYEKIVIGLIGIVLIILVFKKY